MKSFFTILLGLMMASTTMAQPDLPIDFEASIDYQITDFNGGMFSVIPNPDMSGINTSATVGQMVKNTGEPFGGAFMTLANPMDFDNNNTFKVLVWSPEAGRRVLLKVENLNEAGIAFEAEEETTVAQQWEEITFDYSGIDATNSYQKLIFIFDNGTIGDGSAAFTYFVDDIRLVFEQITKPELPIAFEDETIDYNLNDFGGTASQIVEDPTDASNTVLQTLKTDGAETFAGTTIGDNGLASVIPLTADMTTMSVRVWSPDANIPVRLKVEKQGTPEISVETETNTTVAEQWETLVFDFTNEAPGTAAFNPANIYDKVTIFFDFDSNGTGKTYYSDDVTFGELSSNEVLSATQAGFKVGPNPTVDLLRVELPETITEEVRLEIFDVNGRLVSQHNLQNVVTQIPVTQLVYGNYIVKFSTAQSSYVQRIVVGQ